MNKKKLLVILLAAILAFLLSYIFLHNSNKRVNENVKQNNVQEENISKDKINNEQENLFKLTEEEKNLPQLDTIPEEVTKKQIKQIRNNEKKNLKKKPKLENQIDKVELNIEKNSVEVNPKDFEVPVGYKTDNTYKYVYTPTRYKK